MSPGAVALAVAIIAALAGIVTGLLKLARRSPEQRTADVAEWTFLRGGYVEQISQLGEQVARLRADMERIREKAEAGEAASREVAWLRSVIIAAVSPIVQWIDSGAQPPPPRISSDLRALVAEAKRHASDPNTP